MKKKAVADEYIENFADLVTLLSVEFGQAKSQ